MSKEFFASIMQVILFSAIPLIVFLAKHKTFKGFLKYIGFVPTTRKAVLYAIPASLLYFLPLLLLVKLNPAIRSMMLDASSVTGMFRQMSLNFNTVVILLIVAVVKTSLAEEIFFRGFVAKRLIAALGFVKGNFLQATIFGLVHSLLFAPVLKNIFLLLLVFSYPFAAAYFIGYLNEKMGNGSILPGWVMHGLANVLAYAIIGFVI